LLGKFSFDLIRSVKIPHFNANKIFLTIKDSPMKLLTSQLLIALLIALSSCSKSNEPTPEGPIVVDPKKALTGTFIDFFEKESWSQSQWDRHFQEMKEIGMNTVIIQFAAYGDKTWFGSNNTYTSKKYPNALPNLLSAANKASFSVHIGLYFNEEYWDNQTNVDWLHLHADRCIAIAAELNAKFGNDPAFKGWYIPHEPEPYAYNTGELVALFRSEFVDRISNKLHEWGDKPVSIAAFFNSELTSATQLRDFMARLSKSNLQIIMLQDGVGVNHVSIADVGSYYAEADNGLYEGTDYAGEFWTDLETFSFPPQDAVTITRIKQQLQAEMAAPHISKAVSFQYYTDMCPSGPGGTEAAILRNNYYYFIKGLK
jgi:hypothetical protein